MQPAKRRWRDGSDGGKSVIQSSGLAYRYADGPQLHFPDIELAQGGVLVLQGLSGSGKSTWLALAAGLLRASAGHLLVAGQDLAMLQGSAPDAWRARAIGFLPQKLHLSGALSVQGNLALSQWAAGAPDDAEAITQTLHALGLSEFAQRRPDQLSGGQAQRVALARAVLLQPKVILADEPTASLDDVAARAALELLGDTAQRLRASLVIATHDSRVTQALPQARLCHVGSRAPPKAEAA